MNEEKFDYTYSATNDKELQKIKDKYRSKTTTESKMQQLEALDKSVSKNATIVALAIGIMGTLIFGVGITCVTALPQYFIVGVVVGIIGMIIIGVTYPIYSKMVKTKGEALSPQILKLIEEIEKGE